MSRRPLDLSSSATHVPSRCEMSSLVASGSLLIVALSLSQSHPGVQKQVFLHDAFCKPPTPPRDPRDPRSVQRGPVRTESPHDCRGSRCGGAKKKRAQEYRRRVGSSAWGWFFGTRGRFWAPLSLHDIYIYICISTLLELLGEALAVFGWKSDRD